MKKVSSIQHVFLACLLLWSAILTAQEPVALTPESFNYDVVAENEPPENYINTCGPDGDVVYAPTYPGVEPGTGMPADNMVTQGALTYQLQPYDQNNVMRLDDWAGLTGTMTFATPASAAELHFLAMSVYGDTWVNIVVNFTDNTTQQIATDFIIKDWFNNPSVAYILNGRVTCYGYVYDVNSGNPRLYTYGFGIDPANQSKLIESVTITRTGGDDTSNPYFFAISATPPTCGNGKYLVCHIPAGNPENAQQLCLAYNSAITHVGNHGGCYWGVCQTGSNSLLSGHNPRTTAGGTNQAEDRAGIENPVVQSDKGHDYYFEMMPNPASGSVSVHLHGHGAGAVLQIHDHLGRQVWNQPLAAEESQFTISTQDNRFVNGLYRVTVLTNGETISRQLVIAK